MGCDNLKKVFINNPVMLSCTAFTEGAEILAIDAEHFDDGDQRNLQKFSDAIMDNEMNVEKIFKLAGNLYDKGYRKRGFALFRDCRLILSF